MKENERTKTIIFYVYLLKKKKKKFVCKYFLIKVEYHDFMKFNKFIITFRLLSQ